MELTNKEPGTRYLKEIALSLTWWDLKSILKVELTRDKQMDRIGEERAESKKKKCWFLIEQVGGW